MSQALLTPKTEEGSASPEFEAGKQEFARVLKARVMLGYTVESLTDTSAVLVVKGRKRFLRGGVERRTEITINDEGRTVTRDL